MIHQPDQYQEIRAAVRALCAQYPDEYFRKVDEARASPEAFVDALTQAGWMAALIPQEYGGSGLPMASSFSGSRLISPPPPPAPASGAAFRAPGPAIARPRPR